jgi:prepilin-type N-terminal cleavage/methylation domain-containing protein
MKHISIRTHGFTLVEIMIVVAIIGLLAAIAIPNLIEAQRKTKRTACWGNLKQIEGAKMRWSLEHNKGAADTPTETDLFGAECYIEAKPVCPAGGTYTLNALETKPVCSAPDHAH